MPKQPFDKNYWIQRLTPYRNLVLFAVTMLAANAIWKLLIHGDDYGREGVFFLQWNITAFFDVLANHTSACVLAVLNTIRPNDFFLAGDNAVVNPHLHTTLIVWSCTPVKQSFIFLCIFLTTAPWYLSLRKGQPTREQKRIYLIKPFYLMGSLALIYSINILRISAIILLTVDHPAWFHCLHTYVFKYLFYGILFLIWLLWAEHIATPKTPKQ